MTSRDLVVLFSSAFLFLGGCTRFGAAHSHLPAEKMEVTQECPEYGGILGMRLKPSSRFANKTSLDWPVVQPRHVEDALMETGCFGAVRERRTISLRGHHVDLTVRITGGGTKYPFITFPLWFASLQIIPVPGYRTWENHLEYYYNGELVDEFRWKEETRTYLGLASPILPFAYTSEEFSKGEGKRLSKIFTNVVVEKEPAQ